MTGQDSFSFNPRTNWNSYKPAFTFHYCCCWYRVYHTSIYRGAGKSLARPRRKLATATKL